MYAGDSRDTSSLASIHTQARAVLGTGVYGYYAHGSEDEYTLKDNDAAWNRIKLWPRVLRDVSHIDTRLNLLETHMKLPVLVAPTAMHKMAHPDGELATARAVVATGSIMIASTSSSTPLGQIAEAMRDTLKDTGTPLPLWFQLYATPDAGLTHHMIQEAERVGCRALVLTVDFPLPGNREKHLMNKFKYPTGTQPVHFDKVKTAGGFHRGMDWQYIDYVQSLTELPLLLKGVIHPGDAREAVRHKVAGLIVSNHGGRQLDTCVSTAEALPLVASALKGSACILLVDGGIRRGRDVLKSMALGAHGVCVGRPILWGLAVDGQKGVETVINKLGHELETTMALCGASSLDAIGETDLLYAAKL